MLHTQEKKICRSNVATSEVTSWPSRATHQPQRPRQLPGLLLPRPHVPLHSDNGHKSCDGKHGGDSTSGPNRDSSPSGGGRDETCGANAPELQLWRGRSTENMAKANEVRDAVPKAVAGGDLNGDCERMWRHRLWSW